MDIKFNIDLMESLKKLSDSDSIQDYESLWGKFLKHIGEQPISADELNPYLASDKFYDEREYQHALAFIVLFIEKWKQADF
jgi:hypothetical protein